MDWDLLRTFETVARLGSLTQAARALGVSQSTVSRQLAKLEAAASSPLLVRETPVRLTERGAALVGAMRPMLDAALAAQSTLEARPEIQGEVTLTTVGELVRWILAPRLPALYAAHPQLRLHILADNRVRSLAAGEADIALRLVRPEHGDLVTRRLRTVGYGVFVGEGVVFEAGMPWLGLAGSLAQVPEQRLAERLFGPRPARLLVEDFESLARAVAAGLGAAILPRIIVEQVSGLRPVPARLLPEASRAPLDARSVWMVTHRTRQRLPRVRAVAAWLADTAFDRTASDPNVASGGVE